MNRRINIMNPALRILGKFLILELEKLPCLLTDLYIAGLTEKEMEVLTKSSSVLGECVSIPERTDDGGYTFVILVNRDMTPKDFVDVFNVELNHYCLDRVLFKLIDPEISNNLPPFAKFVSEMLCHESCPSCQHFFQISCPKHPKNLVQTTFGTLKEKASDHLTDLRHAQVLAEMLNILLQCPEQNNHSQSELQNIRVEIWPGKYSEEATASTTKC